MPLQIDYRGHSWQIEGETVRWGSAGGYPGWVCSCWRKRFPDPGPRPSCRHTRYVERCELARELILESGPKVVALRAGKGDGDSRSS